MDETNFKEKTTMQLIQKMVDSGLQVTEELAGEIASREDSTPHLIRILKDDKYWKEGGPGDTWAPFSATHILSAMKSCKGLDAIIHKLKTSPEDYSDWLTEDMPSILANFSMKGWGKLAKLVEDEKPDVYVRNAAFRALAVLARENPDIRTHLFSQFRKMIKENDSLLVSLAVNDIAEFRDKSMLKDIKSAFDKKMVDEYLIRWEDIERIYQEPEDKLKYHRDKQNPMDHFKPENISYLWKINYKGRESEVPLRIGKVERNNSGKMKTSRNDPCPCGSGKKYKRCCLIK